MRYGLAASRNGEGPTGHRHPRPDRRRRRVCPLAYLRHQQRNTALSNREVSCKYQSLLRRNLLKHSPWKECRRVHGLRGVYVCMALRLFRWENDASDAYITMCILGHTSLQESLVYTTYHVGDDFSAEECLGRGDFTHIRRRKVWAFAALRTD